MKQLLHYSFVVPLLLFVIHQICQRLLSIYVPFIDEYLDVFCFGAVIMHFYLIERKWIFNHHTISTLDSFIIIVFVSIVSELIFPQLSNRFYEDWWDVAAISLGVLWFHLTFKRARPTKIK